MQRWWVWLLTGWLWVPGALADSLKGNLDLCRIDQGQYCYAWACSPAHPEQLTAVRLAVDGNTLSSAAVLANLTREEAVGKVCGGNQDRGAFFDLDGAMLEVLRDGHPHQMTLEALDPETHHYVPLQSLLVPGQRAARVPIVLFKQAPYQGIVLNPTSIHEITTLPKGVFASANWHGADAVVEFGEITHLALDSRVFTPLYPEATLLSSTPVYVFPNPLNPWRVGQKLTASLALEVSTAERWNGGEVYVILYTLWSDDEGHRFWLGWPLFDLRAVQEMVGTDACQTCTGWPIVLGHAEGGLYGHPAVDSAQLKHFPWPSGPVTFRVQITWQNFVNAVQGMLTTPGTVGYSADPARYRLESLWLSPEVFVGLPGAGGVLDLRFFGLSLAVQ